MADLFAGIGAFHLAFAQIGAEIVFASEADPAARSTYEANFAHSSPHIFDANFAIDLRDVETSELPPFDVLCAGVASRRSGNVSVDTASADPRAEMLGQVCRVLRAKRPAAFFLEAGRGLLGHDDGRTFRTLSHQLTEEHGYSVHLKVVRACDFGLPQLRPRAFIVGFADPATPFRFPDPIPLSATMSDVLGGVCDRTVGYTLATSGGGASDDIGRSWDTYLVDGAPRRLSVAQAKKMQGFPDDFWLPPTYREAMRQLGSASAVSAVAATARAITRSLALHTGGEAAASRRGDRS